MSRRTSRLVIFAVCAFALLSFAAAGEATPITASASGCVARPATPTEFAWSFPEHFQAVVFHDPIAGCEATIYQRSDWLLDFTVNYDGAGGLRVTSNSALFPSCGRLQFDMHKYLANGTLDPFGLVSLVVNLGDCSIPVSPRSTPQQLTPVPVPEPSSLLFLASGAVGLLVRRRLQVGE